jgi:metal-sulfur cluster biosynthetic enzyme/ribosomal protein L22
MTTGRGTTLSGDLTTVAPQLRLADSEAMTALATVVGEPVLHARARLRFGPGRTCEPLARVLDRAIVRAEQVGLDPADMVVVDGTAEAAEDIVRVRRRGYGTADWIRSPACTVRISLRPAGVGMVAAGEPDQACEVPAPGTPSTPAPAEPLDERSAAVREALFEVIDPDLGVNIVDLGFVRAVRLEDQTAVITLTLTTAACPLRAIIEKQLQSGRVGLSTITGFRVDGRWVPAWQPADISDSGREQLRAIGFTI